MVITINGVCFLFIKFMNQDFYELLGYGTVKVLVKWREVPSVFLM